jgi:hypothetical protein
MNEISDRPVNISNIEVLDILQQRQDTKQKDRLSKKYQQGEWVEQQVLTYLKATPGCTRLESSRRKELQTKLQSSKKQKSYDGEATTGFDLTIQEATQILNFMPTEPVEVHLMIHELHDRMTEKEQDALLELISSYVKTEVKSEEEEEPTTEERVEETIVKNEDESEL